MISNPPPNPTRGCSTSFAKVENHADLVLLDEAVMQSHKERMMQGSEDFDLQPKSGTVSLHGSSISTRMLAYEYVMLAC
jgi:hypothetical protein